MGGYFGYSFDDKPTTPDVTRGGRLLSAAFLLPDKTVDFEWEIATESAGLANTERQLRLADDIVRHKLFRLPEKEAARRGLFGEPAPATAG